MSDFKYGDMIEHEAYGFGLVTRVDVVGGVLIRVRVLFEGCESGTTFDQYCDAGYNISMLTLIARPQPWVSLADEYPVAETEVLVCWEDAPEVDAVVDFITFHPEYGERWENGSNPTHWMPLPEPPKP